MSLEKCSLCEFRYSKPIDYATHLETAHKDMFPPDIVNGFHFISFQKNGKIYGKCMICGKITEWNPVTNKFNAFCCDECKEKYVKIFEERMMKARGVKRLTSDPEHQKKMLAGRSISGKYLHSDGVEFTYTGSYELDFLKFLDLVLDFPAVDIIAPSPHTYYYKYRETDGVLHEKFYIPDFFIPSLNLEIEVKDGGTNPNMHHKIQEVDKVKERLKDKTVMNAKTVNYIKIVNKQNSLFLKYLEENKKRGINGDDRLIYIV